MVLYEFLVKNMDFNAKKTAGLPSQNLSPFSPGLDLNWDTSIKSKHLHMLHGNHQTDTARYHKWIPFNNSELLKQAIHISNFFYLYPTSWEPVMKGVMGCLSYRWLHGGGPAQGWPVCDGQDSPRLESSTDSVSAVQSLC